MEYVNHTIHLLNYVHFINVIRPRSVLCLWSLIRFDPFQLHIYIVVFPLISYIPLMYHGMPTPTVLFCLNLPRVWNNLFYTKSGDLSSLKTTEPVGPRLDPDDPFVVRWETWRPNVGRRSPHPDVTLSPVEVPILGKSHVPDTPRHHRHRAPDVFPITVRFRSSSVSLVKLQTWTSSETVLPECGYDDWGPIRPFPSSRRRKLLQGDDGRWPFLYCDVSEIYRALKVIVSRYLTLHISFDSLGYNYWLCLEF